MTSSRASVRIPHPQPFDLLQKTYYDGSVFKLGSLRIGPGQFIIIILVSLMMYGLIIVMTK